MAVADSVTRPPTIGSLPGKGGPNQGPGKQTKPLPMPTVPTKGQSSKLPGNAQNLAEIARKRLAKLG